MNRHALTLARALLKAGITWIDENLDVLEAAPRPVAKQEPAEPSPEPPAIDNSSSSTPSASVVADALVSILFESARQMRASTLAAELKSARGIVIQPKAVERFLLGDARVERGDKGWWRLADDRRTPVVQAAPERTPGPTFTCCGQSVYDGHGRDCTTSAIGKIQARPANDA